MKALLHGVYFCKNELPEDVQKAYNEKHSN